MKPVTIVAALLTLAYLSPLAAGTVECVPTQGCAKGAKPPACCQPPPCEFFEQIKMKKNLRRFFRQKDVKARLIHKAKGDNPEAARLLEQWVTRKAVNLGSELRCKWEEPIGYAGTFRTNSSCAIVRVVGKDEKGEDIEEPTSERQAHEQVNSCAEFVEAIYVHEGNHKQICLSKNSTERMNEGLTVYAKEEAASYKLEIDKLKEKLQQYWRACSAVADASTSRKIAAAGVNVLKKKSPKRNKKQAQNESAGRAG